MSTIERGLTGLVITGVLIAGLFTARGFCDSAGIPPSSELGDNIGAWYDENWQASGYYRLERIGSSENFRYEYTVSPVSGAASNATFSRQDAGTTQKTGGAVDGETPEHKHKYTASGASLPQDVVVTEWTVTGHVHFAASQ